MERHNFISAQQWREGHPTSIGSLKSDMIYARYCTSLLKKINALFTECNLSSEYNIDFALRLGHYVEDVVSKTYLFDSFRKLHEKFYNKKLPFYNLSEDYLDDEVNIEDIKFLVWDQVQQMRDCEAIINPDSAPIEYIAEELFPLICEGYEVAPEVTELHDFLFNTSNYINFIESKKVLFWLMLANPLTANRDIWEDIISESAKLYENNEMSISPSAAFYFVASAHLFTSPCKWLSVFAHEFLAQILESGGKVQKSKEFKGLQHTGIKNFECIKVDAFYLSLRDRNSGKTYKVNVDSLAKAIIPEGKFITTELVSFNGEFWEINGSCIFSVNSNDKNTTRDGELAFKHYLKVLKGNLIGYFRNFAEMRKEIMGDVPYSISDGVSADIEDASHIMVFLNSNGSLNISQTLASTIPDPNNPYFKAIDKSELLASAFNKEIASADMARYFHSHGWYDSIGLSSSIKPERGLELFHDNFDFLMRYFRGGEYHTS